MSTSLVVLRRVTPIAVAISMLAVALTGSAAADPARGHLGGGFIELLLTGRDPSHQRMAAPSQPVMRTVAPAARAPLTQDLDLDPRQSMRHAALSPQQYGQHQIERALDPRFLPQVVDYAGSHRPGTIVIDTPNKFLYLVEGNGKARRYGIGVGRPGFEWAGVKSITRKAEWPDWRPPAAMLQRRPDLPRYMPGGPDNPMGARGLYLGSSLYRIHGTNEPHTIGQAVSSGCIRMRNEDVIDLYERVRVGTRVIVI
jgi:lipoprotein-anchoring transpeptidase ErfK/SrfK